MAMAMAMVLSKLLRSQSTVRVSSGLRFASVRRAERVRLASL
jgi:hypothetical protein